MKEYNLLYTKFKNGTITKAQQKRLFDLAFGVEFMENKNPNKKWRE
tara:strand:+ start:436 stop:573 length:138 start_codon:yes stop_codon:yes gene_type:complete